MDLEYFHKGLNYVIVGSKFIGLYDGYGQLIKELVPANAEDFTISTVLPNRSMQVLKIARRQRESIIKMVAVS